MSYQTPLPCPRRRRHYHLLDEHDSPIYVATPPAQPFDRQMNNCEILEKETRVGKTITGPFSVTLGRLMVELYGTA